MAQFHSYSFGNILLIAKQKPDATRVAGIRMWNELGRYVKKGENGIQILAPMMGFRRRKNDDTNEDAAAQKRKVLIGFRAVYIFDRLSRDSRAVRFCRQGLGGAWVGTKTTAAHRHRDRALAA